MKLLQDRIEWQALVSAVLGLQVLLPEIFFFFFPIKVQASTDLFRG
jgi:hypothetical protein